MDNKEKEFAQNLEKVTRLAREQKNVISKQQVEDAFAELELNETQMQQIFDYLKKHNIGIDEQVDPQEYLTREENDYLNEYIESLKELPGATDAEKEGITISAMSGDKSAQNRLIEIYLPMVTDIAKIYAEQGVYLEDLIGEGNEALTRGVRLLNAMESPSEADAFLSKMMMDAMEEAIAENLDEDARGDKIIKKVQEVADRAGEMALEMRRKVTVAELMEETGWKKEKIMEAIKLSGNAIEDIDLSENGPL